MLLVPKPTSRRSAAAWNLLNSYLSTILAIIKGLVFVPLYLRHFDIAVYGAYGASAEVVGLLGIFDVGIATALYQKLAYCHGRRADHEFASMAGAGIAVIGLTALVILAIGLPLASFVPSVVHAPATSTQALATTFRLTVVGTAAMIIYQVLLGIPQAWQQPSVNGITRIGGQLMEMLLIVLGLQLGWGVVALGAGVLASGLFSLGATIVVVSRLWRSRGLPLPLPDKASLRWLLGVGVPTLLSRVAGQIAGNLEVTLTSIFLGPASAGVYNLTARTFRLAQGFINPIVGSTFSGLAHLLGERGPNALSGPFREIRGIFTLVVSVVLPAILLVNHDFVALWVGPDKFGGNLLSGGLALATAFSSNLFFLYMTASATGQVGNSAYLSALEGAVRVPLMALGLYLLGMPGLAFATALGLGALAVFGYPVVLAKGLSVSRGTATRTACAGMPAFFFCLALGAGGSRLLPHASGWLPLILKGAGGAAVLTCAVLLIDSTARIQMGHLLGNISRRW